MSDINQIEGTYNLDFIKSVEEGREDYKRGECITIYLADLWK